RLVVSVMALPPAPLWILNVPPVSVTVPVPAFRALAAARDAVPLSERNWLPFGPPEVLAAREVTLRSRDCPAGPMLAAERRTAPPVRTVVPDCVRAPVALRVTALPPALMVPPRTTAPPLFVTETEPPAVVSVMAPTVSVATESSRLMAP